MSEPQNWRDWIPTPDGEPFRLCAGFPALPGLWDLSKSPEVIPHWTGILRGNARYVLRVLDDEGQSEQRQQASRALEIQAGLIVRRLNPFRDLADAVVDVAVLRQGRHAQRNRYECCDAEDR